MALEAREIPGWPALTWVARVRRGDPDLLVHHGPGVEVRDEWCIEGVWAGPFGEGGFDRTSVVYGSGLRCRGEDVTFVSSGSTVDRIWHHRDGEVHRVSNSLPALLAASDNRLRDDVPDYPDRLGLPVTVVGASSVEIPSRSGPIGCVYHRNLSWDGRRLEAVPKPEVAPRFDSFEIYHDFLRSAAREIGSNARDASRDRPLGLTTTITRGYDSGAVAAVSREAGCTRGVTIRSARSVLPRSDSGHEVAGHLGLDCTEYPRSGRDHPEELTFWAATGNPQAANMAIFEYDRTPTVLFTGAFGGSVWTKDVTSLTTGLRMDDTNGLGFCEYRLKAGVVHVPLPYAGARRSWEIFDISRSREMASWSVGGGYDRPVPRRILEESGVPREAFGFRKSATQFEESFLWPYRAELRASYRAYLEDRGGRAPWVPLGRLLNWVECNLAFPLKKRLSEYAIQRRTFGATGRMLFQWANHELAEDLQDSLESR